MKRILVPLVCMVLTFLFGFYSGRTVTLNYIEITVKDTVNKCLDIETKMSEIDDVIEWYRIQNTRLLAELLKRKLPIPHPPPLPKRIREQHERDLEIPNPQQRPTNLGPNEQRGKDSNRTSSTWKARNLGFG